jgi:hypothetical protein
MRLPNGKGRIQPLEGKRPIILLKKIKERKYAGTTLKKRFLKLI